MTVALLLMPAFCIGLLLGQRARDSYWIASSRIDSPRAYARGTLYQVVREGDLAKATQVLSDAQRADLETQRSRPQASIGGA